MVFSPQGLAAWNCSKNSKAISTTALYIHTSKHRFKMSKFRMPQTKIIAVLINCGPFGTLENSLSKSSWYEKIYDDII